MSLPKDLTDLLDSVQDVRSRYAISRVFDAVYANTADTSESSVTASGGETKTLANWFQDAPTAWGTAAAADTGTAGATVPLLSGANTWSGTQGFGANQVGGSNFAITGGTLSGTLAGGPTWSGSHTYTNTLTHGTSATAAAVVHNGPTTAGRGLTFQTAGTQTWQLTARGNSTNDFALTRYNPATGVLVDFPLSIASATGIATLNQITTNATVTWSTGAGSAAYGININNIYTATGTLSGGDGYYNQVSSNDLVDYSGGSGYLTTLVVNGGPGLGGNRAALQAQIGITSIPHVPDGQYVGGNFSPFATVASGGSPGKSTSFQGALFGAWVKPRISGNYWSAFFGQEIDVTVTNNAAIAYRVGLLIQDQSNVNGTRGIYGDTGLSFGRVVGATGTAADTAPGFGDVIKFGGGGNGFPTTTGGTLMRVGATVLGIAGFPTLPAYKYGFDARASNIDAGGAVWAGPSSAADGAGNIYGLSLTSGGTVQAKTATLTGTTVTDGGAYSIPPTWDVQDPPSGGTTATLTTATVGISAVLGDAVIGTYAAGTGYTAGDVLTLSGMGGGKVNVATVSGGVPTSFTVNTVGSLAVGSLPGSAAFTASVSAGTLTVTAVSAGTLAVGHLLEGSSVPDGTFITALGTGTGNTGTYILSGSFTLGSRSITSSASVATTGGTGTGAVLVPGLQVLTLTVSGAGAGYIPQPNPLIFSSPTIYKLAAVSATLTAAAAPMDINPSGGVTSFGDLVKLKSYTVATLPAAAAGNAGCAAYVTDATAPTYRGTLTGGGTVRTLVFSDGTAWTSH